MKYFQEKFDDNCYVLKAYSRYKNSVITLEEQFARPLLQQQFIRTLKKLEDKK